MCVCVCVYVCMYVCMYVQNVSRETDVFEMDVTERLEGVEAWVGGN